jgi:hypothetical protein
MGDLTLENGILEIEVGGTGPAEADVVLVDGVTMLGGTLRVVPIDLGGGLYTPQLGDQIPVVASQLGTGGMFGNFDLPQLAGGLEWALMQGAIVNYLEVIESAPLAGDYNDDGVVDAADYTTWRDSLENGTPLVNETASPGTVDEEDYAAWKANFGSVNGPGSTAGVPEPASAALCFLGGIFGLSVFRSGRAR